MCIYIYTYDDLCHNDNKYLHLFNCIIFPLNIYIMAAFASWARLLAGLTWRISIGVRRGAWVWWYFLEPSKLDVVFSTSKSLVGNSLKSNMRKCRPPPKKYLEASTCLRTHYFPQVFKLHRLNTYLVFCKVWRKTCFRGRFHLIYVTDTIVPNYSVHTCKHGICLPEDNNHLSPSVFGSGAWEIGKKTQLKQKNVVHPRGKLLQAQICREGIL